MDRIKKNILELTNCTLAEYRKSKKIPLMVMADNVRSMYNIGSIFRTSDAFKVEKFILAGISGCPPHPEISKTALGAEESVEWCHVDDAYAEVVRLKRRGWKVCVLEQTHGSVELSEFEIKRGEKYLLVVGNEVEGVSQSIVDESDVALEIPQCGTKHSLNVSCSAAIALYHFFNMMKDDIHPKKNLPNSKL